MKPTIVTQEQFLASLLPSPEDNLIITALKTIGNYKKPLGNGKHDITCLWVSEHSKGRDNGTVYFEGKNISSRGGFKCQHSHCIERSTTDFIVRLEALIAELEVSK